MTLRRGDQPGDEDEPAQRFEGPAAVGQPIGHLLGADALHLGGDVAERGERRARLVERRRPLDGAVVVAPVVELADRPVLGFVRRPPLLQAVAGAVALDVEGGEDAGVGQLPVGLVGGAVAAVDERERLGAAGVEGGGAGSGHRVHCAQRGLHGGPNAVAGAGQRRPPPRSARSQRAAAPTAIGTLTSRRVRRHSSHDEARSAATLATRATTATAEERLASSSAPFSRDRVSATTASSAGMRSLRNSADAWRW